MSKEEKGFHIVFKTSEDIERENQETANAVTEEQKTEYTFNGENLYYLGRGHSFGYGFFNEYITKSGVKIWQYLSGRWTIHGNVGNDCELIDNELHLIPIKPTPPSKPVDWSSIEFPTVKNVSESSLADKLPSVKPKMNNEE
jgi:hypothetical protein